MYDDYFKALSEKHENFEYILTLSRPEKEWKGKKGRVTAVIKEINLTGYDAYLCGSKPMLKDTKEALVKSGVKNDRIFYESFF